MPKEDVPKLTLVEHILRECLRESHLSLWELDNIPK